MSSRVYSYLDRNEFELGDYVEFNAPDTGWEDSRTRLRGQVVRVYNSRELYHVEVEGVRYLVHIDDDIRKVERS